MKYISFFIILLLCFSSSVSAGIVEKYDMIYPSDRSSPQSHIFFGLNQWLWYDQETGYTYIALYNPTHIWFGNEGTYIPKENKTNYTFGYHKQDIAGMLYIERACDDTPVYAVWEKCQRDDWESYIKDTVWQQIAIWIVYPWLVTGVQVGTDMVQKSVWLDELIFSRQNPPSPHAIALNPTTIRQDRRLLDAPHTAILHTPRHIRVIEQYTCIKESKKPWLGQYRYQANRLYSAFGDDLIASYYSHFFLGYTPLKKDFWYMQKSPTDTNIKNQEYMLNEETHMLLVSSILQDLNFCEQKNVWDVKLDILYRLRSMLSVRIK